ncbi:hypothetical protein H2200_007868 [Cladophialophora chaetospira]|uniref:Uncharacterized protein n=1 Tax=Cladophialophora chaetospira TaxID=386627 RepID=A0AA38X6R0_9EURO|nr:hypothetical protein H2200_007868 [Cladophialophora chaetospira]
MADAKTFKQDMVVSIRYRNDLPPPPMPPKLLDIDTGGLAQYLTTGYASGLAKREEPNIEVDAEGGMPIDMIGIPGYFLGDESAIMAPEILPVLDPADQALMMSFEQLKSQGAKNNVSFLRKSQYMTASQSAKTNDPFVRPSPRPQKTAGPKPPPTPISRDDPENIKRQIQKGFDLANPESIAARPKEAKANPISVAEREAWERPTHPDNRKLDPLEYYPIIPDLDTGTDMASNWQALKFDKSPLPPLKNGRRDDRIDVGLLMASENPELMPAWRAKKEAYDANPEEYSDPGPEPYTWALSVPKQPDSTSRLRQLFDDSNPHKDDQDLMYPLLEESADGSLRIPFERTRVYTDAVRQEVDPRRVVALSLVDPAKLPKHSRFQKREGRAAYYYPIYERVKMKADRGQLSKSRNKRLGANGDSIEDDLPDQVMVSFREPDARERHIRNEFRGRNDASFAAQWEELEREAAALEERERAEMGLEDEDVPTGKGEVNGNGNGAERGDTPPPTNGHRHDDRDADAEEDEDMRDD